MNYNREQYTPEMSHEEGEMNPEIGRVPEAPENREITDNDIAPTVFEIPDTNPQKPLNPINSTVIIGNITEEERKDQERQKQIDDIIKKRDTPRRIH